MGNGGESAPPAQRPWYDPEAECAVLGVCLLGKLEIVERVRTALPAENPFFLPRNASIWSCVKTLADEGVPTDVVTVASRMPGFQVNWDDRNDRLYLHDLYANAPLEYNPYHTRIIRDYAHARSVIELATRLQQVATTVDPDRISAVIEEGRTLLGAIDITGGRRAPWHDLLVDGATFCLNIPDHIPALWGNSKDGKVLWAQGESLMLVGPPGVGKSTLTGQLVAARMGLLDRVLGFPVVAGEKRVLYVAGDRPAQIARSLRRTLKRDGWTERVQERLIVWRGPPPSLFSEKPTLLREMAVDAEADTVVIDSLKDVASGLVEDVPSAGYNRARQLLLAAGVELIEDHHQVKRGPKGEAPVELADVYGNQQITGGAGSVFLLWGQAGDYFIRVSHLKQPQELIGPLNITHDHTRGMSSVELLPDLVAMAAHAPAGITAADAAVVLSGKPKPSKNEIERARRQLARLVDQGKLVAGMGRSGADAVTYHAAASEDDEGREP